MSCQTLVILPSYGYLSKCRQMCQVVSIKAFSDGGLRLRSQLVLCTFQTESDLHCDLLQRVEQSRCGFQNFTILLLQKLKNCSTWKLQIFTSINKL